MLATRNCNLSYGITTKKCGHVPIGMFPTRLGNCSNETICFYTWDKIDTSKKVIPLFYSFVHEIFMCILQSMVSLFSWIHSNLNLNTRTTWNNGLFVRSLPCKIVILHQHTNFPGNRPIQISPEATIPKHLYLYTCHLELFIPDYGTGRKNNRIGYHKMESLRDIILHFTSK